MPVYGLKVRGSDNERIVVAGSASKAREHLVDARVLSAVQLAEAISDGATVEKIGDEIASGLTELAE